jgi:arylsulfatase A-like enzyme
VVIFVDQWRGDALGFLKKVPVQTPNLDKLAKQSFVAEQMQVIIRYVRQ